MESKPELRILIGLPGIGKSTWASKFVFMNPDHRIICPDDIRKEITGDAGDQSKNDEVFELVFNRLNTLLQSQENVIIDATGYRRSNRKKLIEYGKKHKAKIIAVRFCPDISTALSQNNKRDRRVPNFVIINMHKKWEEPSPEEGFDEIVIV